MGSLLNNLDKVNEEMVAKEAVAEVEKETVATTRRKVTDKFKIEEREALEKQIREELEEKIRKELQAESKTKAKPKAKPKTGGTRVQTGPPKMLKDTKMQTFNLDLKIIDKMERYASKKGISKSKIARDAVLAHLELLNIEGAEKQDKESSKKVDSKMQTFNFESSIVDQLDRYVIENRGISKSKVVRDAVMTYMVKKNFY